MDLNYIYTNVSDQLKNKHISMSKTSNGFKLEYNSENENVIVKLLLDFYNVVDFNILLLNSNGKYSLCVENQRNDDRKLLDIMKNSLDTYREENDYTVYMRNDVKSMFKLFKQSFKHSGNFGIGVKNLAEINY